MYVTSTQMPGVNKFFFLLKKVILVFSEDALNSSNVTFYDVTTDFYVAKCCSFELIIIYLV